MFSKLIGSLFGCRHPRYSFPMTARGAARRNQVGARLGTYVACLDCGKEFAYDWQTMRVVDDRPQTAARSLVTKEAA